MIYCIYQSSGSVSFSASRIRIRLSEVRIQNRILPVIKQKKEEKLDFYSFVTAL
jgi:hypothetical protein